MKIKISNFLLIIILALMVKGFFFLKVLKNPNLVLYFGDPLEYYILANQIINGNYNSSTRPPLYPIFISFVILIFGQNAIYILPLINFMFSFIIGFILRKITRSNISFLFYTANPIITIYECSAYSENLFILLTSISAYYLFKNKPYKALIFMILSAYVRPLGLVFSTFLIIYSLITERRFKKFLIQILILITLITPWILRNKIIYNRFFFSNILEFSMGFYVAPVVYSEIKNLSPIEARKEWLIEVHRHIRYGKNLVDTSYLNTNTAPWQYQNKPELTIIAQNLALKLFISHPIETAKTFFKISLVSFVNPNLYSLFTYFNLNMTKQDRQYILLNLIKGNYIDVFKFLFTKYKLGLAVFTIVILYEVFNFIIAYMILRNIRLAFKSIYFYIFLINFFLVTPFGLGGSRYFINSYNFFILSALGYSKNKF